MCQLYSDSSRFFFATNCTHKINRNKNNLVKPNWVIQNVRILFLKA
jgi:hypothetical protein